MINEILDMSKIETGSITLTLRKFCVQQAVEEVVNILNPLFIKKNITLETNIEDFILNADFQKFRQMLFNLLSNAVKYTQEGGIIKIEAKQEDNYAVISVKDNGIGIDKKNHKRIFKKFEQIGEGRTNSTGLGLSITKELVKLHRGEITVKSALGKGSVFTIRLPS